MTYSLPDVNVPQSHNTPDAAPLIPTDIAPPEVTDTVLLSPGSLHVQTRSGTVYLISVIVAEGYIMILPCKPLMAVNTD